VLVVVEDVGVVVVESGTQWQSAVQLFPTGHPMPLSQASPAPESTTWSPQVESRAWKVWAFVFLAFTLPVMLVQSVWISPESLTPRSAPQLGHCALIRVPFFVARTEPFRRVQWDPSASWVPWMTIVPGAGALSPTTIAAPCVMMYRPGGHGTGFAALHEASAARRHATRDHTRIAVLLALVVDRLSVARCAPVTA